MNILERSQTGLNTDLYWKPEAVKVA
ncbi:MAG: hypothetical protein ACI9DQ_001295, partial [Glaciecola sp.]